MLSGIKSYFSNHYPQLTTNYALLNTTDMPELLNTFMLDNQINVLAFNTRRRNLFVRLFNPKIVVIV